MADRTRPTQRGSYDSSHNDRSRSSEVRRSSRTNDRITVSNSLPDTNPTYHGSRRSDYRDSYDQDERRYRRDRDASQDRPERVSPREKARQRDERRMRGESDRRVESDRRDSREERRQRTASQNAGAESGSRRRASDSSRAERSTYAREGSSRNRTRGSRSASAISRSAPRTRRQQPSQYQTLYQPSNMYGGRPRQSRLPLIIAIGVLVVLILIVFFTVRGCVQSNAEEAERAQQEQAAAEAALQAEERVSFVAVGDNLPNDNIGIYADSLSGETDDGKYDYKPLFAPIKDIIQEADLAYIDQETVIGGNEIGARGWPSFNTTDEMADAVVDAGFDLVATATNHSYDWGPFGSIEHSSAIWDSKPVAWTGTAATEEQYNRLATMERNGITFALLNYTYGVNSYEQADLPEHAVNFIDRDRIAADVARAKKEADVVLVAMHWGTEYSTEVNEEQESLAQFMADMDVDVILGSHPHVIEPMRWVENSSQDSSHKTLVAFSLGNFICDFDEPSGIHLLEGMLSCEFVKNNDGLSIENVKWTPIICHYDNNRSNYAVYTADDYSDELAKENPVFAQESDPKAWIWDTTKSIVGDEWFESES